MLFRSNKFSIPIKVDVFASGGSWSTLDNSFTDVLACYNKIIEKLNSDSNIAFSNYLPISSNSTLECVITNVDRIYKKITINKKLDFIEGRK